jgi:succinate dehydrogenase/fumarate reductase flavoprotein subunit/uncharacterized protein with FMN-binding domain
MRQGKKLLALTLVVALVLGVLMGCKSNPDSGTVYAPGTYTADAMGNNGRVFVQVTLSAERIESIEVDANYETKGLGDTAAAMVAKAIVEGQTLVVDAVAGATFSSKAVLSAVKTALEAAGTDVKALLVPADASQYNRDLGSIQADVIVVGGGLAGMSAALRAAQEGASVILYERSGVLGGAARYAVGWISGADFRIQKAQGVEDTPDAFYRDIIGFAGSETNVNPEIARYYAENSGPAVDWLQDIGVEFKDELNVGIYDPMSVFRVAWGKDGGISLIQGLQNAINRQAAAGKIRCCLFTEVTDLIVSNNAVTGVKTVDNHGNTGTGRAKSVILATGGIGASKERLERIFTNIATGYISTADGSGYTLAAQADAAFHTLNYNPITGGVLPVDGFYSNVRMDVRYNGVIFVDQSGKRVFDEIGSNYKNRSDAWIHADQNILYGIVSESMLDREKPLLSAGSSWTPTPDKDWTIFDTMVREGALIYKADTIEELAAKMGVAATALKSTIDRYNGYVAAGRDAEFGRTNNLIAFDRGPFYALKTIPYAGRSAGGPVADANMRVLNTSASVIPGLYIAGEIIGFSSISGEASVSGMYLGEAVTFGIDAALSAARYALGIH